MCKKVLHTIFRMPIINIIKATVTEKMIYREKVVSCSKLACEQAPVGDSRVQSRANGMNRWLFARGVTTL